LILGEAAAGTTEQRLVVVETNLDDMNPEHFGHVMDRLFGAGALDVYYTPIVMKKSRPATLVSVLAQPADVEALAEIIFQETTTLGLRLHEVSRRCLEREWQEVATDYGRVRVKIGRLGSQVITVAPEYEDCRRLAEATGAPLKAVYEAAQSAYRAGRTAGGGSQ
jgi:uncharacterized protein (DUF111 family)